jgi:hypothetical protein
MSRADGCRVSPFVRNITLCREDYVLAGGLRGDVRHIRNRTNDRPEPS